VQAASGALLTISYLALLSTPTPRLILSAVRETPVPRIAPVAERPATEGVGAGRPRPVAIEGCSRVGPDGIVRGPKRSDNQRAACPLRCDKSAGARAVFPATWLVVAASEAASSCSRISNAFDGDWRAAREEMCIDPAVPSSLRERMGTKLAGAMLVLVVTGLASSLVACNWGLPEAVSYEQQGKDKASFCENLSKDSNSLFVGEETLAWTAGIAAAVGGTLGATLNNDSTGSTWEKNRKYILLTPSVPLGALSAYLFSAASNAAHASGQADDALALTAGADADGGAPLSPRLSYRVAFEACQKAAGYWKMSQTANNSVAEAQLNIGPPDAGP
jgi:hypothetical protein